MDKAIALEAVKTFDVRGEIGFSRMTRGLYDMAWVQSACHDLVHDRMVIRLPRLLRTCLIPTIGLALHG